MNKILTAIVAGALTLPVYNGQIASADQPQRIRVKYDHCGFAEGFAVGYFGIGLLFGQSRRCVLTHESEGNHIHPDGGNSCIVRLVGQELQNYNCPRDVFRQYQERRQQ